MNDLFRLISTETAITQHQIDEKVYKSKEMFHDIVEPDNHFLLHEGDLLLDGHFMLDTDQLADTCRGKWIAGYIITGNLIVTGNVYAGCRFASGISVNDSSGAEHTEQQ